MIKEIMEKTIKADKEYIKFIKELAEERELEYQSRFE